MLVESNVEVMEWIRNLKSANEKIDLLITDPPYPFDNKNGSGRHAFRDGVDEMYNRLTWDNLKEIYRELYQLMNVGGRLYIFANRDGYQPTKEALLDVGFRFLNTIVWDKDRFGGGYHWRNSVEFIHYFCLPPEPAILVKNARNVFTYKKPTKRCAIPDIKYFPELNDSPKPNEIWRDILIYGANEGDIVADPFAGSNPLKTALYLNPDLEKKIKLAYSNSF